MTALCQNSELTLVHSECHVGKQTVIAKKTADFAFSRFFSS